MASNDPDLSQIEVLDLEFGSLPTIASFLIPSADGPVLVESGPASTLGALEAALSARGMALADVRNVLLTHIHLDHAGAAWKLAEGGATVWVHPVGAPHLADPSKLLASATAIYGDAMDSLWGPVKPIPAGRIRTVDHREMIRIGGLSFEALHTPGHARHHIAYRFGDAVFTGDVGGVRMPTGPVVPPCPPPDIDLEAWRASLAILRDARAGVLYLTHFGAFTDVREHLDRLEASLERFASFVRDRLREGLDEGAMLPLFEAYTRGFVDSAGPGERESECYSLANPAFMSVWGLARYWRKRGEPPAEARQSA